MDYNFKGELIWVDNLEVKTSWNHYMKWVFERLQPKRNLVIDNQSNFDIQGLLNVFETHLKNKLDSLNLRIYSYNLEQSPFFENLRRFCNDLLVSHYIFQVDLKPESKY